MPEAKQLCLNLIVKNEVANLPRCLNSVADHTSCWVIGDTGSTDGTEDLIRDLFAKRNIPGELHSFPFHNFGGTATLRWMSAGDQTNFSSSVTRSLVK
jgi:glycosyltransferase involved in cell wall biosynthesis